MGFDDAQYDNEPVDKTEYEAYERRKARAADILKQIAAANSGEDAILPIVEILDEIERCKEIAERDGRDYCILNAKVKEQDLQIRDLKETEIDLRSEITKYRQQHQETNRLNGEYRRALDQAGQYIAQGQPSRVWDLILVTLAERPNREGLCGVTPEGPGDYCHNPMPCAVHPRSTEKRVGRQQTCVCGHPAMVVCPLHG